MEYINVLYLGRLNRRTYLVASIVLSIIYGFVISIFNTIFGQGSAITSILNLALIILFVILGLSFSVRRFHDIGKSGWLSLLFLIPIVGFFVWLFLVFAVGNQGKNIYGESPKDAFEFNKAFGMK